MGLGVGFRFMLHYERNCLAVGRLGLGFGFFSCLMIACLVLDVGMFYFICFGRWGSWALWITLDRMDY